MNEQQTSADLLQHFPFSVPTFKILFCFVSNFAAKLTRDHWKKERNEAQQETLRQRSGNAQHKGAGPRCKRKASDQIQNRANKRKQMDSDQTIGSENETPEKKQHTHVSVKVPGKNVCKTSNKKKLIAGQAKLTSFFRV